jgi:hypothetical protein
VPARDKVRDLKHRIETGEYRVDPTAVAQAILRRLAKQRQNECSYPDSGPFPSVKTTPAGPAATEPIQVRPTPRASCMFAELESLLDAFPGRQTHSS